MGKYYHFYYKNTYLDKSLDKKKLEELKIKEGDDILVIFDRDIEENKFDKPTEFSANKKAEKNKRK